MLSDDERLAFEQSIENVRALVAKHLIADHGAETAVNFVQNLHRSVDKTVLQETERGPKPECRAGCAHCCSAKVEATDPEIFLICRELKSRPAEKFKAVLLALQKRVNEAPANLPAAMRPGCVFLENNLCSIYTVRPAVCRRAHSLSVEQCKVFAAEIPQNLKLTLEAEALMKGTSIAYRQKGLQSSGHELSSAVLLALTNEDSESRWFQGKAPFGECL